MNRRFAYYYEMAEDKERVGRTIPAHIAYWREAALPHYIGGPFADRSGGLITFAARGPEQALEIAARDPFAAEALVRNWWVREWIVSPEPIASADAGDHDLGVNDPQRVT